MDSCLLLQNYQRKQFGAFVVLVSVTKSEGGYKTEDGSGDSEDEVQMEDSGIQHNAFLLGQ